MKIHPIGILAVIQCLALTAISLVFVNKEMPTREAGEKFGWEPVICMVIICAVCTLAGFAWGYNEDKDQANERGSK